MRQKIFTSSSILFLCLQCALHPALRGQQYNCFKAPVLTIKKMVVPAAV